MRQRDEAHPEAIAYSVDDAACRISVGRSTIYAAIGEGAIRATYIGRRTLIPASELQRFIVERMVAAA